ncbi:MAG TPA: cupin domain-containing protein [Candidatus Monoglobus merdigallinarum]|uniref:Cupin domain-containing protein n=1 Tax=Candidatus Monoglobus merdigallinarum TaxID=2838698 RepID=A0A9D1PS64_9FIRM|nr:cupin domain-containing protein [Candidatus Monoglobus merdigallinarum]
MLENIFIRPNFRPEKELVEILAESASVRIEKIVSDGHTSGWYDQDENEFVCLLTGTAELELCGGEQNIVTLRPGDCILIEKHRRHRVVSTTECNWLCVFYD